MTATNRGILQPPIILIHGATSSGAVWEPVLPMLVNHHRVLTPDAGRPPRRAAS